MSSIWGNNIKLSIFGESHGKGIGMVFDSLPSGEFINWDLVNAEMVRRAPGRDKFSTPRKEGDKYEILSGYFEGHTTGTPLSAIIYNEDKRSQDYSKTKDIIRPGHADFTGWMRYNTFNDYRGGGHFSGRLTAPLVLAGAIATQMLQRKGIVIASVIRSIAGIKSPGFETADPDNDDLLKIRKSDFPTFDKQAAEDMKAAILKASAEGDSVGGVIETIITGLPPGCGSPMFQSVESQIASMMYSIPAVKGLEFGDGFDLAAMKGSQANDSFVIDDKGKIKTTTNSNGGLLGGITNGMPIIYRMAIKPTPSIAKQQVTIDKNNMVNTTIQVSGRHDPCIVKRAVPVMDAAAALVILDILLGCGSMYNKMTI